MNCYVLGYWQSTQPSSSDDELLYKLIEAAASEKINFVSRQQDADLIVLMPYFSGKIRRWALALLYLRRNANQKQLLKSIFGIRQNQKVLAVSYENLDHRSWHWFGKLIRGLNIPRLTFWPNEIDSQGCRFPYWWNFVSYDDYPLSKIAYERFGSPLELDVLASPLKKGVDKRIDAVCLLTRHLRWPRSEQINALEKHYRVDVYQQGTSRRWSGSKLELLKKYKYAFAAENSVGYGYETEKLPEAWVAGCIPLGQELNPYSDFSQELNSRSGSFKESLDNVGLLKNTPNLISVIEYMKKRVFGL